MDEAPDLGPGAGFETVAARPPQPPGREVFAKPLTCKILGLLGWIVADVLGNAATHSAVESAFRRPSLAARRHHYRGLMKTGFLCAVLSATAGFFALAIATNGRSDNTDDTRLFLTIAAAFAVTAVVLLATWWREAGNRAR